MEMISIQEKLQRDKKKSQLAVFQASILSLVVIGILIGAAFLILAEFEDEAKDDDGNATQASNATGKVSTALEKIPNMLGLVVLVIVVGVILAVVFSVIPRATA